MDQDLKEYVAVSRYTERIESAMKASFWYGFGTGMIAGLVFGLVCFGIVIY